MQSCLAVSGLQQKCSKRFSSSCVVLYKHCSENTETEKNSVKQLLMQKQKLTRVELWVDKPVRTERIAASTHGFHSAGKGAKWVNCTTFCIAKKNAYTDTPKNSCLAVDTTTSALWRTFQYMAFSTYPQLTIKSWRCCCKWTNSSAKGQNVELKLAVHC